MINYIPSPRSFPPLGPFSTRTVAKSYKCNFPGIAPAIQESDTKTFSQDTDGNQGNDGADNKANIWIDGNPNTDFGACRGYAAKVRKVQLTDKYMYIRGYEKSRIMYDANHDLCEDALHRHEINLPRFENLLLISGTNCFEWLMDWESFPEWEQFREYLFWAEENGFYTIIKLRSHNEDSYWSAPFHKDWEKWGKEIGKMVQRFPNIIGVIQDDAFRVNGFDTYDRMIGENGFKSIQPYVGFMYVAYSREVIGNPPQICNWPGMNHNYIDGINWCPSESDTYEDCKINRNDPGNQPYFLDKFHSETRSCFSAMNLKNGANRKYPNLNIVITTLYFSLYYHAADPRAKVAPNIPGSESKHAVIYLNLIDECKQSIEALKNNLDSIFDDDDMNGLVNDNPVNDPVNNNLRNFHINGLKIRLMMYFTANPPQGVSSVEPYFPWWRDYWIDLSMKMNPAILNVYPIQQVGDTWVNPRIQQQKWTNHLLTYNDLITHAQNSQNHRNIFNYLFPYG